LRHIGPAILNRLLPLILNSDQFLFASHVAFGRR
jgi:hypothetical protein